jgi:hypothetical protein
VLHVVFRRKIYIRPFIGPVIDKRVPGIKHAVGGAIIIKIIHAPETSAGKFCTGHGQEYIAVLNVIKVFG